MATHKTRYIDLKGIAKWPHVHVPKETKYGPAYMINLYPDAESLKKYVTAGCRGKINSDEDGEYVLLVKRPGKHSADDKRSQPPEVVNAEGVEFDEPIGNGSEVTCTIECYETINGVAARLRRVKITKLVPYKRAE